LPIGIERGLAMNDVSVVRPVADLHLLGLLAGGRKLEAVEYLDAGGPDACLAAIKKHFGLGLIDDCMNLTADGRAVLNHEEGRTDG
jgi:hypothetical protein